MKYQPDEVAKCLASHEGMDNDGIEVAFDVSIRVHVCVSVCLCVHVSVCPCVHAEDKITIRFPSTFDIDLYNSTLI